MAQDLVDQRYTADFPIPHLIVKGQDTTIKCPIYKGSASPVAPSAGTVSVYDPSNTAVVDGEAVTITGDIATYQISAATTASLDVAEGWRAEWVLTVADGVAPDGKVHARNDAALIRHPLNPPIGLPHVFRRVPALDPAGSAPIHPLTAAEMQPFVDDAWTEIEGLLINEGNRPNLAMSPSSFRECHLLLTLAYVFDDLKARLSEAYSMQAAEYRDRFRAKWGTLSFLYDSDDDGQADDDRARRSATSTVWLC